MIEGKKYDAGKSRMALLPPRALKEVARVLTYGAQKYDEHNWKKLENLEPRYMDALLRHVFDYLSGEELDEESGLSHLAHAVCCLLFVLEDKLENASS